MFNRQLTNSKNNAIVLVNCPQ